MNTQNIWDPAQSGFRAGHGTESALTTVWDDILKAADEGPATLLVMLDLLATLDTVNHLLLLQCLQEVAGEGGRALDWFVSFLHDRSSHVKLGPFLSVERGLDRGVPKGRKFSLTFSSSPY